jgi:hypothetical protein
MTIILLVYITPRHLRSRIYQKPYDEANLWVVVEKVRWAKSFVCAYLQQF